MQTTMSDLKPVTQKTRRAPKHILIIHSAARIFNQILEVIKSEFPESRVAVLAPERSREVLEAHPLVDEVKLFPVSGRMSILRCGGDIIRDLRSRQFELVVSLYNIEQGLGYSNIDLLAWAVRPKAIRGYNSKGAYVSLTGKIIFKKMVREKTSGVWIIVNFAATVFLFSFITLGIACEWIFRKFFQGGSPEKTPIKL